MSHKLKKGYFVKGQFVAEGSALDLELKNELKGSAQASRTELKHKSAELQKLGEELLTLRADLLARLQLSEKLMDALAQAKRIHNFEGLRRQNQYIGKLMRQLDPEELSAVRSAIAEQSMPCAKETNLLHQVETWRERLIADEKSFGVWMEQHPDTDSQQLHALIRQARKDASKSQTPGSFLRHGRSYRDLYKFLRERFLSNEDNHTHLPSS